MATTADPIASTTRALANTTLTTQPSLLTIGLSGHPHTCKTTLSYLLSHIFSSLHPSPTPAPEIIHQHNHLNPLSSCPEAEYFNSENVYENEYLQRCFDNQELADGDPEKVESKWRFEKVRDLERVGRKWKVTGPNGEGWERVKIEEFGDRIGKAGQRAKAEGSGYGLEITGLDFLGLERVGAEVRSEEEKKLVQELVEKNREIVDKMTVLVKEWVKKNNNINIPQLLFVEGRLLYSDETSVKALKNQTREQRIINKARIALDRLFDLKLFYPLETFPSYTRRFALSQYRDPPTYLSYERRSHPVPGTRQVGEGDKTMGYFHGVTWRIYDEAVGYLRDPDRYGVDGFYAAREGWGVDGTVEWSVRRVLGFLEEGV